MQKDPYACHAFVPLLDLINHKADVPNKIEVFTDGVYLTAGDQINDEEEFFINYGLGALFLKS